MGRAVIARLDPRDRSAFPDVRDALAEPNGLLAFGGDLSPERLENAYRRGIFPWFSAGDPILWWSPDPRTVLFPDRLRISRSLRKRLRRGTYQVTMDHDFSGVIRGCAAPRDGREGTWILPEMILAYETLHRRGMAHSVEVYQEGLLVGGLYGVAVGRAFFGESMFSRAPDASKVALVHLCDQLRHWGFGLIDCQMRTEHLIRLGAVEIPRDALMRRLERLCHLPGPEHRWDQGACSEPARRPEEAAEGR
jgi:leucyl/phenylalanyl-tRNA--protein transferase